jgi:uncharacterized protein (DUF2062 family)
VSTAPAPVSPLKTRTIWQRRIRDPIVAQLTQGITPEKIALTMAVGSAVAVFPILGTSTLLCFLAALALRLNQPITQLINQACWPVHVPAIYLCIRVGEKLFGVPAVHFDMRQMSRQIWNAPAQFFHEFGPSALHAIVAWCVMAPFYVAAVYALSLPIMRAVNRVKAEAAAKARSAQLSDHPVP